MLNKKKTIGQRRVSQNLPLPYDVSGNAEMSADDFEWLHRSDVKKRRNRDSLARYPSTSTNTYTGYRKRLYFRQTRWPSGKHWPQKAGPIDPQYRMAPCEMAGSELEALNLTIIDGVGVKVTETVRIKRLLEIKAENFQAEQIRVSRKNWHQIKLI